MRARPRSSSSRPDVASILCTPTRTTKCASATKKRRSIDSSPSICPRACITAWPRTRRWSPAAAERGVDRVHAGAHEGVMHGVESHCILQITDLHVLPSTGQRLLGVDTAASLDAVLSAALAERSPDALIVTGDIAHEPGDAAYARVSETIARH